MMHIFISASGEDIRPGSTGKAVPGYVATILDEDGAAMDSGTGRLAVKGPTGCRYFDDERQAAYVQNGWNVTGDTYRKDEDGYFWYVSREDDVITTAGYRVGPSEIEHTLMKHPAVAMSAVVGIPDPIRTESIKAWIVLRPGFAASDELAREIQEFVKVQLAAHEYPRFVQFTDTLPMTATG